MAPKASLAYLQKKIADNLIEDYTVQYGPVEHLNVVASLNWFNIVVKYIPHFRSLASVLLFRVAPRTF